MPKRLECEVLQKARYINTLTFTFLPLPIAFTRQLVNIHPENKNADLTEVKIGLFQKVLGGGATFMKHPIIFPVQFSSEPIA